MGEFRVLEDIGLCVELVSVSEYTADFRIGMFADDDGPPFGQLRLHGHIKWDGCSNWRDTDQQAGIMMHLCHSDDLTKLGRAVEAAYQWASEVIPAWDE